MKKITNFALASAMVLSVVGSALAGNPVPPPAAEDLENLKEFIADDYFAVKGAEEYGTSRAISFGKSDVAILDRKINFARVTPDEEVSMSDDEARKIGVEAVAYYVKLQTPTKQARFSESYFVTGGEDVIQVLGQGELAPAVYSSSVGKKKKRYLVIYFANLNQAYPGSFEMKGIGKADISFLPAYYPDGEEPQKQPAKSLGRNKYQFDGVGLVQVVIPMD